MDSSIKINGNQNEEEHIMEQAIGSEISDYILKPVNPNQFAFRSKNLQEDDLVEQKNQTRIPTRLPKSFYGTQLPEFLQDWAEYYKKILAWEIKFDKVFDNEFADLLQSQKEEANIQFSKFIEKITNIGSILQKNQSCLIPLSKKK